MAAIPQNHSKRYSTNLTPLGVQKKNHHVIIEKQVHPQRGTVWGEFWRQQFFFFFLFKSDLSSSD